MCIKVIKSLASADFTCAFFIFAHLQKGSLIQATIYSATTFLEKCRKVVLEKWFCKLGFFFLVNHFSGTRKNVDF